MSMQERIVETLHAALSPRHLDVLDESHMHSRGLETHYKAIIVSDAFAGLMPVKRHQLVYSALSELIPQFHALALHTYTEAEWEKVSGVPASPTCRGGSKHG